MFMNQTLLNQPRDWYPHSGLLQGPSRLHSDRIPTLCSSASFVTWRPFKLALEVANTGHLVFGTLHTATAMSTIDRLVDIFPGEQQNQVRTSLSEVLKGIVSQTLCKEKVVGRVAALEILVATPAISNLMREGKSAQMTSIIKRESGKVIGCSMTR